MLEKFTKDNYKTLYITEKQILLNKRNSELRYLEKKHNRLLTTKEFFGIYRTYNKELHNLENELFNFIHSLLSEINESKIKGLVEKVSTEEEKIKISGFDKKLLLKKEKEHERYVLRKKNGDYKNV
jgi:hypothetical protein